MSELYFRPIHLSKLEYIFKKYINSIDIDNIDIFDVDAIMLEVRTFISNHPEAMVEVLDLLKVNLKIDGRDIFITSTCIHEVCDAHNIHVEIIDELLKSGLEYSISKVKYEISEEIISNDTKKLIINFNRLEESTEETEMYKIDYAEEEYISMAFYITKMCYKDVVYLHRLYKQSIRNCSILNHELMNILSRSLRDENMNSLQLESIFEIFHGNLSLIYKIIAIVVNFNYKSSEPKKVTFRPIM